MTFNSNAVPVVSISLDEQVMSLAHLAKSDVGVVCVAPFHQYPGRISLDVAMGSMFKSSDAMIFLLAAAGSPLESVWLVLREGSSFGLAFAVASSFRLLHYSGFRNLY